MGGGVRERADDLHLLDDRTRPAMGYDKRKRLLVLRTNMDEVDVQPVDLGHEIRQGIQLCLDLAPVVLCRPVARELLQRRQLGTLRLIRDRLPVGPLCSVDAPAQIDNLLFWHLDVKGPDRIAFRRRVRFCGEHSRYARSSRAREEGAPVRRI